MISPTELIKPDRRIKSEEFAREFWKRLVNNIGEPEAKKMMRRIMGIGKPGPSTTDYDIFITCFIYGHLLHFGQFLNDRQIADFISRTSPCYVLLASGAIVVESDVFPHKEYPDDPIVKRQPIERTHTALKKKVERIRREMIGEGYLTEAYSPRPWHRD
jgi:hypothetical protein